MELLETVDAWIETVNGHVEVWTIEWDDAEMEFVYAQEDNK